MIKNFDFFLTTFLNLFINFQIKHVLNKTFLQNFRYLLFHVNPKVILTYILYTYIFSQKSSEDCLMLLNKYFIVCIILTLYKLCIVNLSTITSVKTWTGTNFVFQAKALVLLCYGDDKNIVNLCLQSKMSAVASKHSI